MEEAKPLTEEEEREARLEAAIAAEAEQQKINEAALLEAPLPSAVEGFTLGSCPKCECEVELNAEGEITSACVLCDPNRAARVSSMVLGPYRDYKAFCKFARESYSTATFAEARLKFKITGTTWRDMQVAAARVASTPPSKRTAAESRSRRLWLEIGEILDKSIDGLGRLVVDISVDNKDPKTLLHFMNRLDTTRKRAEIVVVGEEGAGGPIKSTGDEIAELIAKVSNQAG